jgi:uncharacterized protein YndB with AHSA1/START domain
MAENTVKLHRVLRAPAERIYRAFLNPDAMAKWLPPHGFTGKVHHIKAEVGGTYKMSFTNLTTGHSHSFGGEFLELLPNERIRHTDTFDDPNLSGQMQTTVSLKKVLVGTELTVVQEGIPSAIPVGRPEQSRLRGPRPRRIEGLGYPVRSLVGATNLSASAGGRRRAPPDSANCLLLVTKTDATRQRADDIAQIPPLLFRHLGVGARLVNVDGSMPVKSHDFEARSARSVFERR